jgi:hypothetical protein
VILHRMRKQQAALKKAKELDPTLGEADGKA